MEKVFRPENSENGAQDIKQIILNNIPDPERASEYFVFAQKIADYLAPQERKDFLNNPVNFLSSKTLFRGFSTDIYEKIKSVGFYEPQSGEQGSEGVYFSNRPYSAFSYQNKGVIAIIDPDKLKLKSELGILDVSSGEYTKITKDYINKMLPMVAPTGRSDFFYQVQNHWDSSRGVPNGPEGERIIEMRLAQPIETTKIFLVWSENGILEVHY